MSLLQSHYTYIESHTTDLLQLKNRNRNSTVWTALNLSSLKVHTSCGELLFADKFVESSLKMIYWLAWVIVAENGTRNFREFCAENAAITIREV